MKDTVDYTVKKLDKETLGLLRDAAGRMSRELGVPVSLQGVMRKIFNDAAGFEKALQDAAGAEYAAQQEDTNKTGG